VLFKIKEDSLIVFGSIFLLKVAVTVVVRSACSLAVIEATLLRPTNVAPLAGVVDMTAGQGPPFLTT